jgi:hypothetical protein
VHVVAEQRARVGIGAKIQRPAGAAEFSLGGAQQRMPVGGERAFSGPNAVNDVEPGIIAMRLDRDQPAARRESARERRDNAAGLEFDGRPSAGGKAATR